MSCLFDREQLSLYVSDDLSGGEHAIVEAHVAECPACRSVVEQYQNGAAALVATYAGLEARAVLPEGFQLRRKSARWRWMPAAAVILLILGVSVTTQAEAIKRRLIQIFPSLAVEEMSPEEFRKELEKPPLAPMVRPESYPGIEAAEQAAGYPVGRPSMLPAGYTLARAEVAFPGAPQSWVFSYYEEPARRRPMTLIQQNHPHGQTTMPVVEGTTRQVKVFGQNAAITENEWRGSIDRCLHFQWTENVMSLCVSVDVVRPALTDQDLIAIAESIH